jgi:hypothetical protein
MKRVIVDYKTYQWNFKSFVENFQMVMMIQTLLVLEMQNELIEAVEVRNDDILS